MPDNKKKSDSSLPAVENSTMGKKENFHKNGLNKLNNGDNHSSLGDDLKMKAAKVVANKVAPGIGGKAVDAISNVKKGGNPPLNNSGKKILNNSNKISMPDASLLNKEPNQGSIKDHMGKNFVRSSLSPFSPGFGFGNNKNSENDNEEESEETTSSNHLENAKSKFDDAQNVIKFMASPQAKIISAVVLVTGIILIIIMSVMPLLTYELDFNDLVGVGSSGLSADVTTAAAGDKRLEALYNRVLDKQREYSEAGKVFNADLIISVYHVLSNDNIGFTANDMTNELIDELVSYMFEEKCDVCEKDELDENGKCTKTCSYSESLFKENLETKFFIKYYRKSKCKGRTDEVFEYIERYRDYIGYTGLGDQSSVMCSDISLTSTGLSKEQFISYVNEYAKTNSKASTFASNASTIYDISRQNDFNPEMVLIRAVSEGFSPGGSTNNYWGLGCTNTGGGRDCQRYSSFDAGVLGYINNIKSHKYTTLFNMMSKYAYIGSNWFNPGSSGKGGCYYYPYINKYMSGGRSSEVAAACQASRRCSGADCLKTNEEDQAAYTRYQCESMLSYRSKIFNISSTDCTQMSGVANASTSQIVEYAVSTFDNYRYSQDTAKRMQDGYADCSSLVYRVYKHFGIVMSGNQSGEEYRWCENNGKVISASELQPGDLIFYNAGSMHNSKSYKGIGHVEMYHSNGKTFGAHASYSDSSKDISVSNYGNNGTYFCRPTK